MSLAVIMPCARTIKAEYLPPLKEWDTHDAELIVVLDGDATEQSVSQEWPLWLIERTYFMQSGGHAWAATGTAACRVVGMKHAMPKYDWMITLDDDCECPPTLFSDHHASLFNSNPLTHITSSTGYVNTLSTLALIPRTAEHGPWYPRGYPYRNRVHSEMHKAETRPADKNVMCNMGLWLDVPDINGIDKQPCPTALERVGPNQMHSSDLWSLCIMNVAWRAEFTPCMYQFYMGDIIAGHALHRMDDIWGGWMAIAAAQHKGDAVTWGSPHVHHRKAGHRIREIEQEHLGHIMDSDIMSLIKQAMSECDDALSYQDLIFEFGKSLSSVARSRKSIWLDYVSVAADRVAAWAK